MNSITTAHSTDKERKIREFNQFPEKKGCLKSNSKVRTKKLGAVERWMSFGSMAYFQWLQMLVSGRVSHRLVYCNKNVTRKENVTAALYRASADLRILKSTDFSDAQKPFEKMWVFVGFCCSKMREISPFHGGSQISATKMLSNCWWLKSCTSW